MLKRVIGRIPLVVGMFALVLTLGLFGDAFGAVAHAESQAKVTASSAKVRQQASTSSETVGSAARDKVVTIIGQEQGADGYLWYKVVVDANITGYIRSDLLAVIETQAAVTKVNPVSAMVSGSASVRVRANASTSSEIVQSVAEGTALTVIGQAQGADNMTWYQVNFISNGAQVEGFIRSDYVTLSGELTPYVDPSTQPTQAPPVEDPNAGGTQQPDPTAEPTQPQEPVVNVTKEYDTLQQDGKWYLVLTESNEGWEITELLQSVVKNQEAFESSQKTVKSQKAVIIVLVFLLVAAAAGIGFLVFRMKDMMDSAYFNEVEAETIRRRNAAATQGGKKVMHTIGDDKKQPRPQGQRPQGAPQGQRPQGASQGQRPQGAPQGQRPQGAPQGQRPQGAPQGQRPQGAPQGQRPQGAPQGQRPQGAPQGQRPQGAPQGQRPQGAPQGQRPQNAPQAAEQDTVQESRPQGQRPQNQRPEQPKNAQQAQGWQSKNFMADDDDEFEFEFLNYDGDDE